MDARIEVVLSMFEKMKRDGFPIENQMKWGYYFVDTSKDKLRKVFDELSSHKYIFEAVTKIDDGEYQLHVSKIEKLSPEKLHRRNLAFNDLAEFCQVASYDGWDVEKIS